MYITPHDQCYEKKLILTVCFKLITQYFQTSFFWRKCYAYLNINHFSASILYQTLKQISNYIWEKFPPWKDKTSIGVYLVALFE